MPLGVAEWSLKCCLLCENALSLWAQGANHSPVITQMTLLVKTFRGYCYASSNAQADELAADMVQTIMRDGFPEDYWWAKIVDCATNDWRLIYSGDLTDHAVRVIDESTYITGTRWIKN